MDRLIAEMEAWLIHDPVLFHIGKTQVTLSSLLTIVVGMTVLVIVSGWLRRLIADRLLAYGHIDVSTRYTIGSLVRYVMLVVGTMVIMQTAGINLTALSVLAGAVGVGVGFGLQNIVSNFISGLIVMFERPIKIGDRVELAGVEGDVIEIGARATRLMTAEGSVIIMPNQKFIVDPVKNWADGHERSPLVLNIAIDRNGNMREVAAILQETVSRHASVQQQPEPQVLLTGVTGTASFRIIAWVNGSSQVRNRVMHELYLAMLDALGNAGIRLS
jgi:small-conductance mechanosensitive channel